MLAIDLKGKRALVVGVADDKGFGFAIAKALAEAGATICLGTWPPAMNVFKTLLQRGRLDSSLVLSSGEKLAFEKIYPLDAAFDTAADIPDDVRQNRRYRAYDDVSIAGVAAQVSSDFGDNGLDIVIHSVANGPEVQNPLLETSRNGYLAALSTSTYSYTSMVQRFGPLMPAGGAFLALSYLAGERVVPYYGGGMSSAKAALESDTRVLAFEAGRRWGHRVNVISAGPYPSRAASAIGVVDQMLDYTTRNSPLPGAISASDVGNMAAFLCSPLAVAVTGSTVYVDNGYNIMGLGIASVDTPGAAEDT